MALRMTNCLLIFRGESKPLSQNLKQFKRSEKLVKSLLCIKRVLFTFTFQNI